VQNGLARIPVAKRRQLAATLGLFAVLFVAIGAVGATGANTAALKAFVAVAFAVAVLLALAAWGVTASIQASQSEESLDAAVSEAVAQALAEGAPALACGCGHEHDPTELHFTDAEPPAEACAHDGNGAACTHSCDTCVLAAMRPSPTATRAERAAR
jgi:hypothetical protein